MRDELLINVQKFATQVLNVVVPCVYMCVYVLVCVDALYLPSRIHHYSTLYLHTPVLSIVKYLDAKHCATLRHDPA